MDIVPPVKIKLETTEVLNELSGETENRQVFIIEDFGIGMDKEIIERYFLQIGRSYYTTEEFRRNYRFAPTSRFGVGFLSVFAVSDLVTVETYKPSSTSGEGSIRLTFRGPRNYLLSERGERRVPGTRIKLQLRESLQSGKLTELVSEWCRRVEFPLLVDELGSERTIIAEQPEQFIHSVPDIKQQDAMIFIKAFPINRSGIEGEIYIFGRNVKGEESWDTSPHIKGQYESEYPHAYIPKIPDDLTCLHGIQINDETDSNALLFPYTDAISARIDYRNNKITPTVSRSTQRGRSAWMSDPEVYDRCTEILDEHLNRSKQASSKDGWKYKQRLVSLFPLSTYWSTRPEMIPMFRKSKRQLKPLNEVQELPLFTTLLPINTIYDEAARAKAKTSASHLNKIEAPIMRYEDMGYISEAHKATVFGDRRPANINMLTKEIMSIDWLLEDNSSYKLTDHTYYETFVVDLPLPRLLILRLRFLPATNFALLNINHPLGQWLMLVKAECLSGQHNLNQKTLYTLNELVTSAANNIPYYVERITQYLANWKNYLDLPEELYPPDIEITRDLFAVI